eukprot:3906108-Rhodomonas_salina.2
MSGTAVVYGAICLQTCLTLSSRLCGAICLRALYAIFCTDVCGMYVAIFGTDVLRCTRSLALIFGTDVCRMQDAVVERLATNKIPVLPLLSSYAHATPCPVLTHSIPCIFLRQLYRGCEIKAFSAQSVLGSCVLALTLPGHVTAHGLPVLQPPPPSREPLLRRCEIKSIPPAVSAQFAQFVAAV